MEEAGEDKVRRGTLGKDGKRELRISIRSCHAPPPPKLNGIAASDSDAAATAANPPSLGFNIERIL